jgi:CarD family transcriptional regulator
MASHTSPRENGSSGEGHLTFKVGDKAVYPAHGVGEVTAIENREISGTSQNFYILRILENGMKIMIPTNNVRQVGLREVISRSKVDKVFKILKEKSLSVDTTTWNRRYREYMEKIKTGSVFEVAEVLRDLYLLKSDKDLSFCELKLLDTARSLLIKELSVAKNCDETEVEDQFKKIFAA